MEFIESLKPYLFGALQWARAREKFRELWFAGIVVGVGFLFYGIADPTPFQESWRDVLQGWWEQARLILAMTQTVSTVSNIAADLGAKSTFIPVTDSVK